MTKNKYQDLLREISDQRSGRQPVEPVVKTEGHFAPIGLSDVFEAIPAIHKNKDARYVNLESSIEGVAYEEILSSPDSSNISAEQMRSLFFEKRQSFCVQRSENYFDELDQMTQELSSLFGTRVSATLFATPGDTQSVAVHYDSHDVLVVQLDGAKKWQIYHPVVRDAHEELFELKIKETMLGTLPHWGSPSLKTGDLMWLPRGWIHKAVSPGNEFSLHVSFVIFTDVLQGLFKRLIEISASKLGCQQRWRQPLSTRELQSAILEEKLEEYFAELKLAAFDLFRSNLCTGLLKHFLPMFSEVTVARQAAPLTGVLEKTNVQERILDHCPIRGYALTIDGSKYFWVNANLVEYLSVESPVAVDKVISALANKGPLHRYELVRSLEALVFGLGLYSMDSLKS